MTTKTEILHIIRENCLVCCSNSWLDIEKCTSEKTCKLFPYRFGKDPEEASAAKRAQGKKLYERKIAKA